MFLSQQGDVLWPLGYHARFVDGVGQLVDGSGYVVAEVGDLLALGGSFTGGRSGGPCGGQDHTWHSGAVTNCTRIEASGDDLPPFCREPGL